MPRRTRKLQILLADDHELVRRGIRGLLSTKRKWRVVGEARDGLEAIEKAKKLKPDVVILDIDMPNLNGLEATPRIRQVAPSAKIIILTLHESAEMVRRAIDAGAQGFVLKSDLATGLETALAEISKARVFLTPKASEIVMREFLGVQPSSSSTANSGARLTSREQEVIRLVAEGKSNKEVAAALSISVRTAEAHRASIMKKLGLKSLAELIHYALQRGMTTKPAESSTAPATGVPNAFSERSARLAILRDRARSPQGESYPSPKGKSYV